MASSEGPEGETGIPVPRRMSPAASPRWRSAIPGIRAPRCRRQQRTRWVWHETCMLTSIYGQEQSNGYVTNLLMRVGDYAHAGTTNISVIDADSYWIDGYFEETKMPHVCIGDRAEAQLMGYRDPIIGRVQSVTRGISVSNAAPSTQGLPNVDPVYTWVRLAQRVPVRIRITNVPAGVPLVSGMTATVTIRDAEAKQSGSSLRQRFASLVNYLVGIVRGSQPSPGCVPRISNDVGATVMLPTPRPTAPLSAAELNPGLAPDMNAPPRR